MIEVHFCHFIAKLDEKSRYIKDLENREKNWEVQMENVKQVKNDLESQLKQAKEILHENKGKFTKEVTHLTVYFSFYLLIMMMMIIVIKSFHSHICIYIYTYLRMPTSEKR